jgi:hypothetical protein
MLSSHTKAGAPSFSRSLRKGGVPVASQLLKHGPCPAGRTRRATHPVAFLSRSPQKHVAKPQFGNQLEGWPVQAPLGRGFGRLGCHASTVNFPP